jgi:hypothetical protein
LWYKGFVPFPQIYYKERYAQNLSARKRRCIEPETAFARIKWFWGFKGPYSEVLRSQDRVEYYVHGVQFDEAGGDGWGIALVFFCTTADLDEEDRLGMQ